MSDTIPFSKFVGHLKRVRPAAFDDNTRQTVERVLDGFFEAPPSVVPATRHRQVSATIEQFDHVTPYLTRRYAGESSLPRGRYYTVSDADGNDNRTLVSELIAYCNVQSEYVVIFDGHDNHSRDKFARVFNVMPEIIDRNAIIVAPFDPFADDATAPSIVRLPFEVDRVSIENVIDLRLPQTQRWLAECLTTGLPECMFSYGGIRSPGLVLGPSRPAQPRRYITKILGREIHNWESGTVPMGTLRWPPRGDWDEKAVPTHRGDDTFLSILPFLLFSKRGGSPITEAIGFWLRRLGAEGFVYPSARNDFGVTLRDGTMVQSEGWNFVDYRNLALPETDRWLIEEPDSWSELVNYEEYQVAFNRPHSGSWRLVGREAATLQAYSAAQDALYQKLLTVPQGIWKRAKDSRDRALSTRSPARNQDPLESLVTRYHDRNYKLSRDGVQDLIGREKLNESMTGSPRAYRAFYLLGLAEAKLGDHERAVNAFEKAAKIDSTKSEPLANMGNSLKVLGRYDEAVVAYQAALRLNPLDNVAAGNMPAAIMMATTLRNDARQEVKKNNEGGQLAK